MWMLNSPDVRRQAAATIKGVGRPRLGLGGIRALQLPLPPLAEQRRIVATIEEKLSRIDAVEAAVENLIGPFNRGQGRIGALRRAILAHAYRGDLVPQDPDDEPASVLLERIAAERAAAETANSGQRRRRATTPT
jgi:type I restriction enzyme S subunit